MPRGDKSRYTDKQVRQAEHIEEGYRERGVSETEAERRAWATVNKQHGGGKKSGSGRNKPPSQGRKKKAPEPQAKAADAASTQKAARPRRGRAARSSS